MGSKKSKIVEHCFRKPECEFSVEITTQKFRSNAVIVEQEIPISTTKISPRNVNL